MKYFFPQPNSTPPVKVFRAKRTLTGLGARCGKITRVPHRAPFNMSTIYVHWPFCRSKCHYCDFNSIPCAHCIDYSRWLEAYKKILQKYSDKYYQGDPITSVYFGGGTPSLLPSRFIASILEEADKLFKLAPNLEITLEANPKAIGKIKAMELKKSGVNRISIGVQSIIDVDLKMLGRIHSAKEAKACVCEMSEIFDNLSIDMIYNRPGQSLRNWEEELNAVLAYPIKHISLYELIIEPNTRLKTMIDSGILPLPSSSAIFFEKTIEIARSHGFEMYEVSNFAKDKHYGQHNISYWKYEDYYGIGAGAHSRCTLAGHKIAIAQISDNYKWLKWAIETKDPAFNEEVLTEDDEFKEQLIMGLRSKFGINTDVISEHIKTKYGLKNKLKKLQENSYIIKKGNDVVLTDEGIMRLNLIIRYLTEECV